MGEVYSILEKGSERARNVAAQTLDEVKSAMELPILKINDFIKSEHFLLFIDNLPIND
ncbi:MAG: hypothetical protein ACLRPQ_04455 [Streptococcus sp.]